ncbi:DUF2198 family protein [Scopulibacillus cellulosilyticus]|uniref:DUF2198 family protein n=1 Tax=Scopulibacillus cellulosilyticus TaxID=2665665 RepID=A0ABW2PZV9_9BACL
MFLIIILAIFAPGLVTMALLRVTFNAYVGPILTLLITIVLLIRFAMPWYTIVLGILSVLAGYVLAKKMSLLK